MVVVMRSRAAGRTAGIATGKATGAGCVGVVGEGSWAYREEKAVWVCGWCGVATWGGLFVKDVRGVGRDGAEKTAGISFGFQISLSDLTAWSGGACSGGRAKRR